MKHIFLTLLFIILSSSTAIASSAISITQKNVVIDNDVASWTIHTPAPGWVVDRITKPIDDEIQVGLMRSPAEQESVLKYERPIPGFDKRFRVEVVMYQRNDITGSLPVVSTHEAFVLFKVHF